MKIQYKINKNTGEELLNELIAVDDIGEEHGICRITENYMDQMMPERPHQISIQLDGEASVLSLILGGAMLRALTLAKEGGVPAHIYANCAPDDTELMEQLELLGFQKNDAVVQMSLDIAPGDWKSEPVPPKGVVPLADRLQDDREAKYFLMRFNRLMSENQDIRFVEDLSMQPGFWRTMIINKDGLLGEVLVVAGDREATIQFVQVNENYRRQGMGSFLMEWTLYHLAQKGISDVYVDVRAVFPGNHEFFDKLGFRQEGIVSYFPCIDWDPTNAKARRERELPELDMLKPITRTQKRNTQPRPPMTERQEPTETVVPQEKTRETVREQVRPKPQPTTKQKIAQDPDEWN